jgi:hypothetical protein
MLLTIVNVRPGGKGRENSMFLQVRIGLQVLPLTVSKKQFPYLLINNNLISEGDPITTRTLYLLKRAEIDVPVEFHSEGDKYVDKAGDVKQYKQNGIHFTTQKILDSEIMLSERAENIFVQDMLTKDSGVISMLGVNTTSDDETADEEAEVIKADRKAKRAEEIAK